MGKCTTFSQFIPNIYTFFLAFRLKKQAKSRHFDVKSEVCEDKVQNALGF